MWSSGSGASRAKRLAHGHRAHARVVGDAPVQLAQEGAAVAVVILPGVFAIQNDGHQRVAAGGQNAGAVFADAPQKIVGRRGGVHLGVDKADQVAQEMIAEDHAHAVRPFCCQRYGR